MQTADWQRLRSLRLAALADTPDVFGSTLSASRNYKPQDWQRQITQLPTFVAVLDGVDVGMVRGAADASSVHDALLMSMWVAPAARGQGAARQLIQAVIDWAKQAGHKRLLLDVADFNQPAVNLYQDMGFLPTGETGNMPPPREHIGEHRRALVLCGGG